MLIVAFACNVALMWVLGSLVLRFSALGSLVLGAFIVITMQQGHPANSLEWGVLAVFFFLQAPLLWWLGHYKFARKRGYWKSSICRHVYAACTAEQRVKEALAASPQYPPHPHPQQYAPAPYPQSAQAGGYPQQPYYVPPTMQPVDRSQVQLDRY